MYKRGLGQRDGEVEVMGELVGVGRSKIKTSSFIRLLLLKVNNSRMIHGPPQIKVLLKRCIHERDKIFTQRFFTH